MKRILKKVVRELKRPLKRLEQKIRAGAQRFVLRTIERNPEQVYRAIAAFAPPGTATPVNPAEPAAPQISDAMLIAFLRSSQRKNRRLAAARCDSVDVERHAEA